jgi:hypothetical protein
MLLGRSAAMTTTEVGASEFVVRKGAEIKVVRVASNEEYLFCGLSDPAVGPAMPVKRLCR